MALFVISYDLRKQRNYDDLLKQLRDWNCVSPLKSVWFGSLTGSASAVRDALKKHIDNDDGLMVVELKPECDWASVRISEEGNAWLKAKLNK